MELALRVLALLVIFLPVAAGAQPLERRVDQWLAFQNKPASDFHALAGFINANPDWPSMGKLRGQAEAIMPANLPDAQIIAWFDKNPPQTGTGAARYAGALLNRGRAAEAKKTIREAWISQSMSREEQRSFYARFQAHIDRAASVERLDRQLLRGNYTNGRAVAEALGGGYPALAEARISLAMDSSDVESRLRAVPAALQNDAGLLYERLRWRRQKNLNDGAMAILAQAPKMDTVSNAADWWKERHILIRRLMETRQYGRAYELARKHGQSDGLPFTEAQWVTGFLALRFVNKPWEAFESFERMYHTVETPISKSRASYWAGRASAALGHPDIARQWYQVAAQYSTTFYGQMALAALGMPDPKIPPPRDHGAARAAMEKTDMGAAARYLARAGYRAEAAAFLMRGSERAKSVQEYEGLSAIAAAIGQQNVAIRIAGEALNKHGVVLTDLLYPTMEGRMREVRDTEWALAHAIIRQESRFDQNAVSSAGARGLMQLMPATARETAKKIGINHQNDWLTARPEHNIRLGSRYIRDMTGQYGGEYVLAAAAYNAGPGRVNQWLRENGNPRASDVDMIDWIERIPIYETRNYVQRVLEGVFVYRRLLGTRPVGDTELAHLSYSAH